jgi:hypothetical protein
LHKRLDNDYYVWHISYIEATYQKEMRFMEERARAAHLAARFKTLSGQDKDVVLAVAETLRTCVQAGPQAGVSPLPSAGNRTHNPMSKAQ